MNRNDIFTRPLPDVLLEADHDDLELEFDPQGRARLDRWVRKKNPVFDPSFEDPAVDRMREAWMRSALVDEGGDALFETRAGVGDNEANGRVDVAKVETLLESSGAFDLKSLDGPTGFFAADKGDAIRAFQRANGISEDGTVRPRDATMAAFKAAVQPKIRQAVAARAKAAAEARPSDGEAPRQQPPTQLAQTRPSGAELERAARELEGYTPDRHALFERTGKWPNNEAWREIEFAKANPNVTINPRMEAARIWAIRNNRKAVFDIKENPNANNGPADHRDHAKGITAVSRYDAIIVRESRDQGLDPDLIRAIMYVENADGNPSGTNKALEAVGLAESLLPMNINDRMWAGIGGVKRNEFDRLERNIHAGVALIKAISDRLRPEDRTPAKIGAIYNFSGAELVNNIGSRIQRTYDEKTWKK